MKEILIVTYYWPPSGGAGVQRWLKFSKYLPEFGIEPVILTVDEKFASYAQLDHSLEKEVNPGMKVFRTRTFEPYSLYKQLSRSREIPYGGFSNQKKVTIFERLARFIRGNLFIPDPRRGWNRHAVRKALEIIKRENIRTVITTGPPHSSHLIGLKLKEKTGINWIADFRDPWTDIYYYADLHHTRLAASIDRKLESRVLAGADRIITVSSVLRDQLAQKIPGSSGKLLVIPNGYDQDDFEDVTAEPVTRFTITYTGTIAMSYRIESFIGALCLLPATVKKQVAIRFIGNVPSDILQLFAVEGLEENVEVMGYIPHRQAISHMKSASMLLLAIPDSPGNRGIITGKFFEYLASDRPILAIGPSGGDMEHILNQCEAGKLFGYDDTEGMKQYILGHFEMERNGITRHERKNPEKFSRRNLTRELVDNLEAMPTP